MEKGEKNATGRRKVSLIHFLWLALIILSAHVAAAQDFPAPRGYVNDFAGVIDKDTEARLTALCTEVEQKTGAELTVVTVSTVGDFDYTEYSIRLFEKWSIGKKAANNGVMLFVTTGERRVRIEVGYGLEGILPDITAGRLLDEYVVPEFRGGDYGSGLLRGAEAIAGLLAADAGVEITGAVRPAVNPSQRREERGFGGLLIPLLIFFLLLVRPRWLWPFLFLGGMRGRSGRHGGWGGGGFGGGFGGGGFGGFGGGMGGGGGAGRGF